MGVAPTIAVAGVGTTCGKRIVRPTADQTLVVRYADWTARIKWQMTVVSRGETMLVPPRWNGCIVQIEWKDPKDQKDQTGQTGQIDMKDRTGPEAISRCRKIMLTEKGAGAPKRCLPPIVHS